MTKMMMILVHWRHPSVEDHLREVRLRILLKSMFFHPKVVTSRIFYVEDNLALRKYELLYVTSI